MAYEFWLHTQEGKKVRLGNFTSIDQGRNYWRIIAGCWPRPEHVDDQHPALSEEEQVERDDRDELPLDHEMAFAGFELRQIPSGETVYRGNYLTDEC